MDCAYGVQRNHYPLLDLRLQTEAWLFTIKRDGMIAARIEGSFGVNAFQAAVEAALK